MIGTCHFIVIGAMKSATTSLHMALAAHPSIAVPRRKELDFFSDPGRPREPAELAAAYERRFRGCSAPVTGESSPSYSMAPLVGGVPEAIAAILPDVRLVYCLRDPVERMRSHYRHEVLRSRERRTAAEGLHDDAYLVPSLYGSQLEGYLEHFEGSQIAVVSTASLIGDTVRTLASILDFLGLAGTAAVDMDAAFTSEGRVAFGEGTERLRSLPGVRQLAALVPTDAKRVIAQRLPGAREAEATSRRLFATATDWTPSPAVVEALERDRVVLAAAASRCVTIGGLGWAHPGGVVPDPGDRTTDP